MTLLLETGLPNLHHRGKVRDTYELGEDLLLIIVTDRVSAFDIVLPNGIPDKGIVLNQLSGFWFDRTSHIVPNHVVAMVDSADWLNATYGERVCASYYSFPPYVERRSMVIKKARRVDVECVVRGYLSGSAWTEYQRTGEICGVKLPPGLRESDKLTEPIFTPTTKASEGHDEPITVYQMKDMIGEALTGEIIDRSLAIYDYAARYAESRGIIIADTKMEFGIANGTLILIDELLTPDSSRFWDAATYQPGRAQPSSGWNRAGARNRPRLNCPPK